MPTEPKERKARPVQPKCVVCNHPRSFHGGGTNKCQALGCECATWQGAEALPVAAEA